MSHLVRCRGLLVLAVCVLSACGDRDGAAPARTVLPAPVDELSKKLEALTQARTRAVWTQHMGSEGTDPYSNGVNHVLMGLDTRDGLGVRQILPKKGNYTKPLLSSDGQRILYSAKKVTVDDQKRKKYSFSLMVTDWNGTEPRKLFKGYAVDVWRDPASGRDWVYAVDKVSPSPRIAWAAREMVRFPLDAPDQVEVVWDRTQISPDNIQLSSDGRRASGQFPWPNGGQFVLAGAESDFLRTRIGCWASMAPDASYISWMLDGDHRHANLYAPGAPPRVWRVDFGKIDGLRKGEIYHPRWSNHPRFVALTGPYLGEVSKQSSGFIGKGGRTAEVVVARFNPEMTGFDGAVTLTHNENGETYPDLWIDGGAEVALAAFPQGQSPDLAAERWPADRSGLVFVWEDRDKSNSVKRADGSLLDCNVVEAGAARYGRAKDLLLDSGSFGLEAEAAAQIRQALGGPEATVEFFLRSRTSLPQTVGSGPVLRLPGVEAILRDGALIINGAAASAGPLPLPAHVTLLIAGKQVSALVNEAPAMGPLPLGGGENAEPRFGGGDLDLGLSGIAVYARALGAGESLGHRELWLARHKDLPEARRVRVKATLVEASAMPTEEGIDPYTRALVAYYYKVDQVLTGELPDEHVVVKHWAMMDLKPCRGFPRKVGGSYELTISPEDVHPELEGQRVVDDLTVFDAPVWYDVAKPAL